MKASSSKTSVDLPPTSSAKRTSSWSKKKRSTVTVFIRTNSDENPEVQPKKAKGGRRSRSKSKANGIVLERKKSRARKRSSKSSKGFRKSVVKVDIDDDEDLQREMSDEENDEEKKDDQQDGDFPDIRKTTSFEEPYDKMQNVEDEPEKEVVISQGRCARGFNPCCTCRGHVQLRTWCKVCGLFLAGFSVLGIIVSNSLYVNRINFLLHLEEDDKYLGKNPEQLHVFEKSGLNIILILGIFTGLLQLMAAQCYIPCLCILQAVNSSIAVCLVIVLMVFEIAAAHHDWELIIGMFIYLFLITMFAYFATCSIGFYCQLKAGVYDGREHESSVEQAL